MKVFGRILVLLFVVAFPRGQGKPFGEIINQAAKIAADGFTAIGAPSALSVEQDSPYQGNVRQYVGPAGYSQISSSSQQIANAGGYQDATHHVMAPPGVGITIGIGHHDHPQMGVGTNYVQTNGLQEGAMQAGQAAYYGGGQKQIVTTTETKHHIVGDPYGHVGAQNPNNVYFNLNSASYGSKSESTPTTPQPSKYVGSYGESQEKQAWAVHSKPTITLSVAHPETQGYPYSAGSNYAATHTTTGQVVGYQPQPAPGTIVETTKQTRYLNSYGGADMQSQGGYGVQSQSGYGVQSQSGYAMNQAPKVHLMISSPNQGVQTSGIAANSNSYYSTSQQNSGGQTLLQSAPPSGYQTKTIRKIETVHAAQPVMPVQRTAIVSTGVVGGGNIVRNGYGNQVRKTTVESVHYNPGTTYQVSTGIPTSSVVQSVNRVSGYGLSTGSVAKLRPTTYTSGSMGNVAVTRVQKTSVAVPQVRTVGVSSVNRGYYGGRYVGTYGGAPGILTATGPATNTVTRVTSGSRVTKVPAVKNVYTQHRTTYVQPSVSRQYGYGQYGSTYVSSAPVVNRAVSTTTYNRAIGTNVARVSSVNNQLYSPNLVPTQFTVRRYGAVATQPNINMGLATGGYGGSNVVKTVTTNHQLHAVPVSVPMQTVGGGYGGSNVVKTVTTNHQIHSMPVPVQVPVQTIGGGYEGANVVKTVTTNHQIHSMPPPVQTVGGGYYNAESQYSSNAYGAAKPSSVAVHITPMMAVPVGHAGVGMTGMSGMSGMSGMAGHETYHESTLGQHDMRSMIPVKTTVHHTVYKTVNDGSENVQTRQKEDSSESEKGLMHHVIGGGNAIMKMFGLGGSSGNSNSRSNSNDFGTGSNRYVGGIPETRAFAAEDNTQMTGMPAKVHAGTYYVSGPENSPASDYYMYGGSQPSQVQYTGVARSP